ncbi:uncharacterized protein METZ01_LOCUS427768, partial [marine metagenome]
MPVRLDAMFAFSLAGPTMPDAQR